MISENALFLVSQWKTTAFGLDETQTGDYIEVQELVMAWLQYKKTSVPFSVTKVKLH